MLHLHVAQPAEVEYNDDNYSVHTSGEVAYIGISREQADVANGKVTARLLANWESSEIQGVSSDAEFERLLDRTAQVTSIEVIGADNVADLDTYRGSPTVWLVATAVHEAFNFETAVAAYRDVQAAAARARQLADEVESNWEPAPRALPVAIKEDAS